VAGLVIGCHLSGRSHVGYLLQPVADKFTAESLGLERFEILFAQARFPHLENNVINSHFIPRLYHHPCPDLFFNPAATSQRIYQHLSYPHVCFRQNRLTAQKPPQHHHGSIAFQPRELTWPKQVLTQTIVIPTPEVFAHRDTRTAFGRPLTTSRIHRPIADTGPLP
jgi:hypothetical protein